jgi:uncharacterized protein HemX
MHRLAAALVILVVVLAPATVAQAQIGPNVPAPLTEPPPPPPAPNNFDDDGGISLRQKVLIFGVAALVLGVIAFVIVRDARRAAPTDERPRAAAEGTQKGTAKATREREREQRAKRAKAKAARQQRKRNRPH